MTFDLNKTLDLGADAVAARTAFDPAVRAKYMNASEAMTCIRRQWYQKRMPDEAAPQDWGQARRGNVIEAYTIDCLRAANVNIRRAGEEQESIASNTYRISATPDGVIYDSVVHSNDFRIGLEVKSLHPNSSRSKLPRKAHEVQLQIGMALLHEGGEYGPFDYGLLVYVDAADINKRHVFKVEPAPGILEQLAPRAATLLRARTDKNLEREGVLDGSCRYCPFTKICGTKAEVAKGVKRANRGSTLDGAAREYIQLKGEIADLTETQKAAAQLIKDELAKRKINKTTVGNIEIELQSVKGRVALDRRAVAAAGIDLAAFEKTGAPSTRLLITKEAEA